MKRRFLYHNNLPIYKGIIETIPLLIGIAPFGMIYGVLAVKAGFPAAAAQAMSAILFAGSSQFMIVNLVAAGSPWLVVVLTAVVVNLRHALYSASLAPFLKHLPAGWKAVLAYVLVDEAYAVGIHHYEREGSAGHQHWFLLGSGLAVWVCWQASTALGIFLGAQIPAAWSLDFTLALTFIAIVVPGLKNRPLLLSAVTAAVTTVVAHPLPYKLGLILAALAGIAAGLWSERQ
ncbi:AzlC family ABC transporter permease [Bellilinea sp.]|uniref:AzlC family ABC transporter permease n=1 Tax=Bellilinea sp. TaxID=2838785 RepID=UPI002ADD6997|nr:AzlC family ABC transporter permease [Bellilinea sp.]